MYVFLDPQLANILLELGSMNDGADMAFDLWLHALITTSGGDYNNL
jgi:hypothetical protein